MPLIDPIDEAISSGWSVLAVGVGEEITDPAQLAAAEQLDLRPFAGGDRPHFVKVRPEFLSGRRIA